MTLGDNKASDKVANKTLNPISVLSDVNGQQIAMTHDVQKANCLLPSQVNNTVFEHKCEGGNFVSKTVNSKYIYFD